VHSIPQSEETRAELSQIAWVAGQVTLFLDAAAMFTYLPKDYFSSSQQTSHGHCAGCPLWYPQVHPTRLLPRLESSPKYPALATRMGWFNPDARYPETETFVDGKQIPA
jgi:hypothetical protein